MTNEEATIHAQQLAVPATGVAPPECAECGHRHRLAVSCETTRTIVFAGATDPETAPIPSANRTGPAAAA